MTKLSKAFLFAVFFLSGAVSLVFEVLWIRILSLGVGSTSTSMSLVLSIFFLGLGLGSFLAGRYLSRTPQPLRTYGLLEGFAGLYGFGIVFVLNNFQQILATVTAGSSNGAVILAAKFILVGVFLLAPTLCMGASLPLMTKALARHEHSLGRSIGLLYGINTLGAVFGALITSFVLIPNYGVLVANHVAAVSGLAILVVAFILQRSMNQLKVNADANAEISPAADTHVSTSKPAPAALSAPLAPATMTLIFMICAVSGFASIAAQVVWNKYLSIFFGTNIYGIGLTLSVFLLGLAAGSLIFARFIDRLRDRLTSLYWLLLAAVLAMVASSYALDMAPLASSVLTAALSGAAPLLLIKCVIAGMIVFVPTAIFGALFPLAIKTITAKISDAPQRIGMAYAANTAGSIIGSCLAGLILIPYFGSTTTIRIAAGSLAVMAGLLAWRLQPSASTRSRAALRPQWGKIAASAVVLLVALSLNKIGFESIIKSAYIQNLSTDATVKSVLADFKADEEDFQMIIEGSNGVISLSHDPKDGESYKDYLRLKTSGLNESVYNSKNLESLPKYEALLGFLPYAFHRGAREAFVVGFGGGYTVDFMTSTPLRHVQVAELEPGILDAARYARGADAPLFNRSNLHIDIEDARFVLASAATKKFDIIVSQPSHSWLSGAANLFTEEFFGIVQDKLADGGIYSQWLNLYNMDTATLRSIVGTFYAVFPHGMIFTDQDDHELIMLGSNKALHFNAARIDAMLKDGRYRTQLENVPITAAADVLSLAVLDRDAALEMSRGAPLNTDLNAYAETRQSRIFYQKDAAIDSLQTLMHQHFKADVLTKILAKTPAQTAALPALQEQVLAADLRLKKYEKFHSLFAAYEAGLATSTRSGLTAGLFAVQAERYATAAVHLQRVLGSQPSAAALEAFGAALTQTENLAASQRYLDAYTRYSKVKTDIADCYAAEALMQGAGHPAQREQLISSLLKQSDRYGKACGLYFNKVAGLALASRKQLPEAQAYLERYYAGYGDDPEVAAAMLSIYLQRRDWTNAKAFAAFLPTVIDRRVTHLTRLADFYTTKGFTADATVLRDKAGLLERQTPSVSAATH